MTIVYAHPEYLNYAWWLLLGLPLLAVYIYWRRRIFRRIAQPHLLALFIKDSGSRFPVYTGLIILAALLTLIIGLANPQVGSEALKGKKSGLDIIVAMDISRSMDAEDIKPSRLERAKAFASRLSDKLAADRIGLVVFAGNAYVQMPLSSDHGAVKMFLDAVTTDMAPTQGTAIGDAVRVSEQLLNPPNARYRQPKGSQVILIFSDGETHDEDALDETKQAASKGIKTFTIGVGREEGAPVPDHDPGKPGALRDENGQIVISRLDEAMLKELASAGNGSFFRLVDDEQVMKALGSDLSRLGKSEKEVTMYASYKSQFQWLIGAGLALFLLEFALTQYYNKKENLER